MKSGYHIIDMKGAILKNDGTIEGDLKTVRDEIYRVRRSKFMFLTNYALEGSSASQTMYSVVQVGTSGDSIIFKAIVGAGSGGLQFEYITITAEGVGTHTTHRISFA